MRKYDKLTSELVKVVCNKCGKEMQVSGGRLEEGAFHAEQSFGYFSRKDGQKQVFDLCEECYDKMVEEFSIPVEIQETTEFL